MNFSFIEKIAYDKGYTIDKFGILRNKNGVIINGVIYNVGKVKYRATSIRVGNKVSRLKYHRFQAYTKYGDKIYDNDIVVRHLNRDGLCNTYDNILIGTSKDNSNDIPKHIRIRVAKKASINRKNAYSKEKIDAIKKAHEDGYSYNEIMSIFDISSKGTVSYIINHNYEYFYD